MKRRRLFLSLALLTTAAITGCHAHGLGRQQSPIHAGCTECGEEVRHPMVQAAGSFHGKPLGAMAGAAPGPPSGAVAYPYYSVRGPRDFLANDPPSIGR